MTVFECPKDGCDREGDRSSIEGHIYASDDHDDTLVDELDEGGNEGGTGDPQGGPEGDPSGGTSRGVDEDEGGTTTPEAPSNEGQQAGDDPPEGDPQGDPLEGGLEGGSGDRDDDTMPTEEEYQQARSTADAGDEGDENTDEPPATPGLPADPVTVGGVVVIALVIYIGMKWVRSSSEGAVDQEDVEVDLEDSSSGREEIELIEE